MNSPALQVSGSARTTADRLHKNANPTMKDQSLYCGGKPSNRPEKIESIPATIRAVPTEIPSVDSHSTNTGLFSALIKLPAFTAFNSPQSLNIYAWIKSNKLTMQGLNMLGIASLYKTRITLAWTPAEG